VRWYRGYRVTLQRINIERGRNGAASADNNLNPFVSMNPKLGSPAAIAHLQTRSTVPLETNLCRNCNLVQSMDF
jgi:hypothetical protein